MDRRFSETIYERAAKVLGWTVEDTRSFSPAMLREIVCGKDPELVSDISRVIQSGNYISGEPLNSASVGRGRGRSRSSA